MFQKQNEFVLWNDSLSAVSAYHLEYFTKNVVDINYFYLYISLCMIVNPLT